MPQAEGSLIIDIDGLELTAEDKDILQHPVVGGVIFFSRNYHSPVQIKSLAQAVRGVRKTPLLLTVDQEGGRVQRFREGFTRLPSLGLIGKLFQQSAEQGLALAECAGLVMAAELLVAGIDLSFAPVLDLDLGLSSVIGDRSFAADPATIFQLAQAYTRGMRAAGMSAVAKHFPGHGSVTADSHVDLPIDNRDLATISMQDLKPFQQMISTGVEAVMAAHIVFPQVDHQPVGFSARWLQDILRKQLKFDGLIFSDALDMQGAHRAGGFPERVEAALSAGCDMALICNHRAGVIATIDHLPQRFYRVCSRRLGMVRAQTNPNVLKNLADTVLKFNSLLKLAKNDAAVDI